MYLASSLLRLSEKIQYLHAWAKCPLININLV